MRVLFVFALVACLLPCAAQSRTWHVRSDGAGDAPTIQAAIDSTSAGDTVLVEAGTHEVASMILVASKSDLKIIGEEPAGSATILGTGGPSPLFLEIEYCSNITVKGLSFSNCHVALYGSGTSIVENNVFRDAVIKIEMTGGDEIRYNLIIGGAINCSEYPVGVNIHHNVIAFNAIGAGINLGEGNYHVYNNIVTGCRRGIYSYSIAAYLDCNDAWGNEEFNYGLLTGDPVGTNGNISADPQFCGANPELSGNFYLQSDSPCAPGNHPDGYSCGLIGALPVGCGATATQRSSWSGIKSLYR